MNRPLVLLLLVATAACSGPYPLAQAQPSADALAREVLSAISQRQHARLRALALDELEFERRIWPGLPAARPERNVPWSYAWGDLRQKSEVTLARTLRQHGGTHYELEGVTFLGATTHHGSYTVHRETVLSVRDAAGDRQELRVMGSMIEAGGEWKVFSYVVDE
jgi:hypothetical protein